MSEIITASLAIIISAVGIFQYLLAKDRFKLDLFDKRSKVINGVRVYISNIIKEADLHGQWIGDYRVSIVDATFLFNDEITDFLEAIYSRSINYGRIRSQLQDVPTGEERSALVKEQSADLKFLMEQLPLLQSKFAPYMKFRNWNGFFS